MILELMPQNKVDRSILQGESIELFTAALRNLNTRDPYERRLIYFLKTVQLSPNELVNLAKNKPLEVEKKIISFISSQSSRAENGEITGATVGNSLKAIRLLLEMNDVVSLNWKKIRKVLPRARRYALDRIPTSEEIKEIYDAADIRGKALTLLLISSGVREGSIEGLTLKDYSPIEVDGKFVAGRLRVYAGDPECYMTFISAEACYALDKYLQFRKEHGEMIEDTSPLFRDKFDAVKGYKNSNSELSEKIFSMSAPAVRQYYNRLLYSVGIRNQKKRRHEFSVHGFRKWFKTKTEIAGMKPINIEILMGHSVGISDSYYRPTEKELLDDYLKISQVLTVSQDSQKMKQLEQTKNDIEAIKLEHRKQVQDLNQKFDTIMSMIQQNPKLVNVKSESLKKKLKDF